MVIRSVTRAGIERDNTRVTGGDLSVIGTSTDIADMRGNTGVTLGETETGTREETEDVTLRGPDGVLSGCGDMAPT